MLHKKQLILVPILLGTLVHLYGTFGRSSGTADEQPKHNYFGTGTEVYGTTYHFEYLAIGERTKTTHIPVYIEPTTPELNPRNSVFFIDLETVSEITHQRTDPTKTYDGVTYCKISITFKDTGSKQERTHAYLIEADKRLFCDTIVGTVSVPHEVSIEKIEHITIQGMRSAALYPKKEDADQPKSPAASHKARECHEAARAVEALQKESASLPAEQRGMFEKLANSLRDWIGGICST